MPRFRTNMAILAAALAFTAPAIACPLSLTGGQICYLVDITGGEIGPDGQYTHLRGLGNTPQSVDIPQTNVAGFSSAKADSANNGTLLVRAGIDNEGYTAIAGASLTYVFRLSSIPGMPADAYVPLHVSAFAESLRNSNDGVSEFASFLIQQDGGDLIYQTATRPFGREMSMFSIDQWINVRPNDDILVDMGAEARASSGPGYSRQGSGVYVDPVFTIAPEFASRYTLTGLPVGAATPPSAVPEPASWAMLTTGFAAAGLAMRRRKVAGAAAA